MNIMNENSFLSKEIQGELLRLFNFRLNNLGFLLDRRNLEELFDYLPLLEITFIELASYKFYILKYISQIVRFLISTPQLIGLEDDLFVYLRLDKIQQWDKFRYLSYYKSQYSNILLKVSEFSKKVAISTDLESLCQLRNDVEILITSNLTKKMEYNEKESIIYMYFYELDYKDYRSEIIKDTLDKENYCKLFWKDEKSINTIMGFYKAFFLLVLRYLGNKIQNKFIFSLFSKIQEFEKNYSEFYKYPFRWPWFFGEEIRKYMGRLDEFKRALE